MTANQTDPAAGTRSTPPEAPAEAASDAPTGNPAQPRPTMPEGMGEFDRRAIDTVRVLAMDAVQKAGNGHPGTVMSMAPTAYLLFQKWLRHDPGDPNWVGRDRFILSMGHSSLTLYIQLFLSGYGLELSDLQALCTWGSRTPGHPEVNHTPGVETTTGPLGQGVANAVGMAMAARRERGLLDPEAAHRALRGAAGHPRPGLRPHGRRQRDRRGVAHHPPGGDRPAGLSLSRQNLPVFDRTKFASAEGAARGGYVLAEAPGGTPEVILIGTGSEVQIAVAARETLESGGVPTRVVSLPCWEWFAAQDRAYREQVLPPAVRARVSVEAGVPMGWPEFVGDAGRIVGLNHYGASAAYTVLYEQFGLTADAVVAAARESLAAAAMPPLAPSGRTAPAFCTPPPATADPPTLPTSYLEGTVMAPNEKLAKLSRAGVAVWLDDLSRDRIRSGDLQSLIDDYSVVGVTTNPTIFAAAISGSDSYDDQVHAMAVRKVSVAEALRTITAADVRDACDLLAPVARRTGRDGRVSLEVAPGLAHDTDATAAEAAHLWWLVDRPNLFIKIPATQEGLAAITTSIAAGISVNVTLIFSPQRYRAVMDAYLSGLEQRVQEGGSLAGIESVASFFVSRVDTEVDRRLDKAGAAPSLKGKAALANAQLAYQAYQEVFSSGRWRALQAQGAQTQRPLWASTGVKNQDYPDTLYVSELIAPDTVNTMPEKTLKPYADHGTPGKPVQQAYDEAAQVMKAVADAGVDLDDVFAVLEDEGVQKFTDSWDELTESVRSELENKK